MDLGSLGFGGKRFWPTGPTVEEHLLKIRRALRVRGAVTDADEQAIKPFAVVPGYDWGQGNPPYWEYDQAGGHSGGSYDITLSTIYRSGSSASRRMATCRRSRQASRTTKVRPTSTSSSAEALDRGRRPPPRRLAAGRRGHRAGECVTAPFIKNGTPPAPKDHRTLKTGSDGRFSFPQQEPPYSIVVLHDRGFAEQTIDATPASAYTLTIKPWGRVEGTLRIGSRPVPRTDHLAYERRGDTPKSIPWWSGEAKADASGLFVLERVKPSAVHIARNIPVKRLRR